MQRRQFIGLLGGATAAWALAAHAQKVGKMPVVGVLWHAGSAAEESMYLTAFIDGMREQGYVDGRNVVLEHRFPAEMPERFERFATELVGLKADVLAAAGQPPALALQRATRTIPIVFMAAYDPLGVGLVDSIARPSGNITGTSVPDLIGKRLEIFKEAIPSLSRVAILVNAANASPQRYVDGIQSDAHALNLTTQLVVVAGPNDLDRAISSIAQDGHTGVAAAADVMFYNERKRIAEIALAHRLPTIFHNEDIVKAGGLLSYGANIPAIFRRSAVYVDKILKGAKPSDLPVEQPTLYRFIVNLKTAKALDLALPPILLTRADEVIE